MHFSILKRIIFLVAKTDILWLNKNYSQLIELIRFSKERTAIMKKQYCFLLALVTLMVFPLSPVGTVHAQQTASLEVAMGAICQDVVNRQPIDVGNSFEASVGMLYCLTKITGASGPTEIIHVWYFGDTERARVNLAVNSASWRTYSSKRIQAHEIGGWHVDVIGPGGDVLETMGFTITP